jgi:hypothetical protein
MYAYYFRKDAKPLLDMFHSMSEGLFKKVRVIEVLWSIRNNNIVIQEVNQA